MPINEKESLYPQRGTKKSTMRGSAQACTLTSSEINRLELILTNGKRDPLYASGFIAPCVRLTDVLDQSSFLTRTCVKHREEKLSPITIPSTGIELLVFAMCPCCRSLMSRLSVQKFYCNRSRNISKDINIQKQRDSHVQCRWCGSSFYPSLVAVKRQPIAEFQLLSRARLVTAIEEFYLAKYNRKVLTREPASILRSGDWQGIAVDITIEELAERPALVANLLFYTPPASCVALIRAAHKTKQSVMFGIWLPVKKSTTGINGLSRKQRNTH